MRLLRRWVLPLLLVLVAASSFGAAVKVNVTHTRADNRRASPVTPVLSARRVPTFLATPTRLRRLQSDLDSWLRRSPKATCLTVTEHGLTLYARNPTLALAPASVQKLLTATAALDALDANATFRTIAAATAPPSGGVINGDLWVVGGGDPILATPEYAARFDDQPQIFDNIATLADAIVAAGVTRVEGAVVGDESRYDSARFSTLWPLRYIAQHQTGPLSALFVNDGFSGYPPMGEDSATLVAAPDPPQYAAGVLALLLEQRGVTVVGGARSGVAPSGAVTVASQTSLPLSKIVGEMLLESDNGTAELLAKELGRLRSHHGTTAAGSRAVLAILKELDQPLAGTTLVDGSGLAPQNRVTCALLDSVLDRPGTGSVMVEHLPVAGESGTLRDRFVGTPVAGRLKAKTGTLNQVTSLAGVIEPLQGGSLTFAYIANAPESGRITVETMALQDQLATILLAYPRTPDLTRLGPKTAPEG